MTPNYHYLQSLARRYSVRLVQMDVNKYRISGQGNRIILMTIDQDGDAWYGTYGVPPFPHPITKAVIPATRFAMREYGTRAEGLEDAFIAASMPNAINQGPFANFSSAFKSIIKRQRYDEQYGKCYFCKIPMAFEDATLDHLLPLCRGGADAAYNMAAVCLTCNGEKAAMTEEEFATRCSTPLSTQPYS